MSYFSVGLSGLSPLPMLYACILTETYLKIYRFGTNGQEMHTIGHF